MDLVLEDLQTLEDMYDLYKIYELYESSPRSAYAREVNKKRRLEGEFHTLVKDLRDKDAERHLSYFRMNKANFDVLVEKLRPLIFHKETHRNPVRLEERLSLTLKILATGCSMRQAAIEYRLGISTVHEIFREICGALYIALNDHIKPPQNSDDWEKIKNEFFNLWQFPNCVGALDGKHIRINAPQNSGSAFFNYKKAFSIVFMALTDARYRFTMLDVGHQGSKSDAGIFAASQMRTFLETSLPQGEFSLPGSDASTPFVIVADEAFGLKPYIMRPYSGRNLDQECRIFNYRLSRARRIVESSFGILSKKWRFLQRPIEFSEDTTIKAVKAAIALHNWLIDINGSPLSEVETFDDTQNDAETAAMRNDLVFDRNVHYAAPAVDVRETLKFYFLNEGSVPWQMRMVNL